MATNQTNGIPRGIEILIKKASVDAEFRTLLMRVRSKAAGEIGLELDVSEAIMLDAAPEAQLAAIIASTRVDPSKKAAFLGKAAAVMLVALGASAASLKAEVLAGVLTTQPSTQPASRAATKPTIAPATQAVAPMPAPIARPPIMRVAGIVAGPIAPPEPAGPGPMPATYPAVNAGDVERLVPKLDAEDFKDREAAQKALVDLGAGAVPILQDLQKKNKYSLEVNTRIERVIRAILPPAAPTPPTEVILQNGVRAR